MAQTNFRAQDFKKGSKVNVARSSRDKTPSRRETLSEPVPTTQPIVAADANPEDVPAGTVPEVLTWVGEDKARAQKALDHENKDEKPRKGLVAELEKISSSDTKNDESLTN